MTAAVYRGVLPLTKGRVVRWFDDACTALLGVCEMPVDVIHRDDHIRVNLIGAWRAKRAALLANNYRTITDHKLGMSHRVAATCTQSLAEAKSAAEPLDRLGNVAIDEDRNDRCIWRRAIRHGLTR